MSAPVTQSIAGCGGTGLCMACLTEHAPCVTCHGTGSCPHCEANGEPCQTGGLPSVSAASLADHSHST